jgi:hypothetical protein
MPAWLLDLIAAALGSIAANGLGCGLLSFAGHRSRQHGPDADTPHATPVAAAPVPTPVPTTVVDAVEENAPPLLRFAISHILPDRAGGSTSILAITDAYQQWCADRQIAPLKGAALGRALSSLFKGVGVTVEERDGEWVAVGVQLKDFTLEIPAKPGRRALGHMARVTSAAG